MSKRFLGIGINRYKDSPLNGCIPDIMLAYKVAKEKFGFNEFRILDDEKATKKEILNALKWAFSDLKDNDYVYVHYSAHGSYVPCTTETASSETDNYDEIWIPYDYDFDSPLRDNDLNKMITLANPKAHILILSDSCFSGSVLRNSTELLTKKVKNRFLPPPISLVLSSGEINLDDELNPMISRKLKTKFRLKSFIIDTQDLQKNAVLITGCGEHQTSADIYIPELKMYHGALTYNLFKVLAANNWNMQYAGLIKVVNRELKNDDYEQVSQLECRKDLMATSFLGGTKK